MTDLEGAVGDVPAHLEPLPRSSPLPLLLMAALLTVVAGMLVVVGVPILLAAAAVGLAAVTLVLRAERTVLRALRARVALPAERDQLRSARHQVAALSAAADVAEPELLIGGEDAPDATAVARSRRASTVVLSEELLRRAPADRTEPLARAIARIALGDAVVVTIAAAPGAMGATLLSRILLRPGASAREAAALAVAARLAEAARSGAPTRPAVPYREFVKA